MTEMEEREGDYIGSREYGFEQIGSSVPLTTGGDFHFDPQSRQSRPLIVCEHHRIIYVAHSAGFFLVKTKEVLDAAKEIKESGRVTSVQELCEVDVPIDGTVDILALSTDSSWLAVSVGGSIKLYSTHAVFIKKELKPCYSYHVNESSFVKDMQWIKRRENSYVALSSDGRLYQGGYGLPLQDVMDNVDAVEWSVGGEFVAVAKKNIVSILTSNFEEKRRMSLPFQSWIGDSDVNCTVKVDSIRWDRYDSIILGCFRLTADGMEEDYLVQVISTKGSNFIDASSKLFVLSFPGLFPNLIDDAVPFGSGPHLFLSYLEKGELAISANRKNRDNQMLLFGWRRRKGDQNDDVAVVEINRDSWLPKITQEKDDDILVVGLCIDKVSRGKKIEFHIGFDKRINLSPDGILICLTDNGNLSMLNVICKSIPNFLDPASFMREPTQSSLWDEVSDMKVLRRGFLVPISLASMLDNLFEKYDIFSSGNRELPILVTTLSRLIEILDNMLLSSTSHTTISENVKAKFQELEQIGIGIPWLRSLAEATEYSPREETKLKNMRKEVKTLEE